jgi:hypothetical protein
MSRPLGDLIRDFEFDPSQWEVIKTDSRPSTNMRNKGGQSIQELFRHRVTGEEMVRHTIVRADGSVFAHPHFRPHWK